MPRGASAHKFTPTDKVDTPPDNPGYKRLPSSYQQSPSSTLLPLLSRVSG